MSHAIISKLMSPLANHDLSAANYSLVQPSRAVTNSSRSIAAVPSIVFRVGRQNQQKAPISNPFTRSK